MLVQDLAFSCGMAPNELMQMTVADLLFWHGMARDHAKRMNPK